MQHIAELGRLPLALCFGDRVSIVGRLLGKVPLGVIVILECRELGQAYLSSLKELPSLGKQGSFDVRRLLISTAREVQGTHLIGETEIHKARFICAFLQDLFAGPDGCTKLLREMALHWWARESVLDLIWKKIEVPDAENLHIWWDYGDTITFHHNIIVVFP